MCYDEQCSWNEKCRQERAAAAAVAAKRQGRAAYEAVPMIEYTP